MRSDIQTASGHYFNFERPDLCTIRVEDVAHALSHLCRFTGHVRTFYSVAQHAVLCSYLVPEEGAYAALHHDDAEAFVGDMASPLKQLLPAYKAIERQVEAAVFRHFGLPPELPRSVKHADLRMLATERRDLMPHDHPDATIVVRDDASGEQQVRRVAHLRDWSWAGLRDIEPMTATIVPVQPEAARQLYMRRHHELVVERGGA